MKKNNSTFNRLFSKIFSLILLSAVSLSPTICLDAATGKNALITSRNSFVPMRRVTTYTVSNATSISIPDTPATGSPYPSPITISGAVGTITNVSVVLRNITIARPRNLEILLVAPGNQALLLVSDVGGVNPASASSGVTLTLQDGGAALPSDTGANTQIVTGTFRPTNNGAGEAAIFPAPAPTLGTANYPPNNPAGTACTGCVATFASVFAQPGVAANGTWRLFVFDGAGGGTPAGTMANGWTLSVTVNDIPTTAAGATVSGRVVNSEGRSIAGAQVAMTDANGAARNATTNPFGYFRFEDVPAGATYVFSVKAKGYQPASVAREVAEDVADFEIVLVE